jgi:hypothetical protein
VLLGRFFLLNLGPFCEHRPPGTNSEDGHVARTSRCRRSEAPRR